MEKRERSGEGEEWGEGNVISYIKGTLLLREPGRVIVNTGNLGFSIRLDQKTELKIGPLGAEIELFTFQVIRENEWSLYGFDSLLKLEVFEVLLGANKVGPRIALSFLSTLMPERILEGVLSTDTKSFGKVPGAGTKLLSQVILDCQKKAKRLSEKYGLSFGGGVVEKEESMTSDSTVLEALLQLGFTRTEAKDSMNHTLTARGSQNFDQERQISECLKYFYLKK
jgi:holliday junction DNA helicase RuvA